MDSKTHNNQEKIQNTHKLLPPMEQENTLIQPQNGENHARNDECTSDEKRSNFFWSEPGYQVSNTVTNPLTVGRPLKGTQKCENGEKDENFEITHKENDEVGPREKLKRHRKEVAGQVWIPEMWGQEVFLKDWIDCGAFDASLVPQGIMSARASLVDEATRTNSGRLRLENRC